DSLFCSFPYCYHIPQHITTALTLQHAGITLLPVYCLMKAFEEIRRANQGNMCPRKIHRHITQGLLKVMRKGCYCVRLAFCPCLSKRLISCPFATAKQGR